MKHSNLWPWDSHFCEANYGTGPLVFCPNSSPQMCEILCEVHNSFLKESLVSKRSFFWTVTSDGRSACSSFISDRR